MVCQACGSAIEPGGHFCPRCGAQVMAAPPPQGPPPPQYPPYAAYAPPPYIPRVQRHLQALGTLWCVYAVFRIISGIFGLFIFRAVTSRRWGGDWPFGGHHWGWGPAWMQLMPVIMFFLVLTAMFGLFVGYSLITRKPWGRVLAIVAGILVLFKIPLGTALGIYTLWVLAPSTSGMEYDSIAEPG